MIIQIVIVLMYFLSSSHAQKLPVKSECLNSFYTNRSRFDVCLTHECIIFRNEIPFVFMDPSMKNPEHEAPFRCIRHTAEYEKLDGAFFEMVKAINPLLDSYCVWAGPKCTFDGELEFLTKTAVDNPKNNITASYQFMVGGLLFILAGRFSPFTFRSAAFLEDKLQILGPPQPDTETWSTTWAMFTFPFEYGAWIFILISILAHVIARLWISYYFSCHSSVGFSWRQFRARVVGNYYPAMSPLDENEQNWKLIHYTWVLIATLFTAIVGVLWEVAIAVDVFRSDNAIKLPDFDPARFAITKNTTMDKIFGGMMDRTSTLGEWNKYNNLDQVFQAVSNKSNEVKYTLSYEIMNRFKLSSTSRNADQQICDTVRLYQRFPDKYVLSQNPPSFTGVWFYSSNINGTRRVEIDKAIFEQRDKGKIKQIVSNFAPTEIPGECLPKPSSEKIGWRLIFMLLLVLPGLPVTFFVSSMLYWWFRSRYRPRLNGDNGIDEEEIDEELSQPNTSTDTSAASSRSNLSHFRNPYPWS